MAPPDEEINHVTDHRDHPIDDDVTMATDAPDDVTLLVTMQRINDSFDEIVTSENAANLKNYSDVDDVTVSSPNNSFNMATTSDVITDNMASFRQNDESTSAIFTPSLGIVELGECYKLTRDHRSDIPPNGGVKSSC